MVASGQGGFTQSISNANNTGAEELLPDWARPADWGIIHLLGVNQQTISFVFRGDNGQTYVSGTANSGYNFNYHGSWFTA